MKKLLKKYKKNIAFLKQVNSELYEQILSIEQLIQIKQRYFLEYTDKCFNIFDEKESKYLLSQDTLYDAKYKAFQLDNSIKQSISLIETKTIDFQKTFDYGIDSYQFINQYIQQIDFNQIKLQQYKFIFFGIILGEDINKIVKKLDISSILFCEQDIELFRLSLFIVPYYKIAKKRELYFAIGDKFLETFEIFYKNDYKHNHFIKYHLVSNEQSFNYVLKYISLNNPLMYTFSEFLGSYKRGFSYIKQKYNILQILPYLKNKKVLFLGAGPSVELEIKFILNNKDNFFIVTAAGTLGLLQKYNIKPNMIISVDGSTKIEAQFKGIKKSFLQDIPFICSLSTHKNTLQYIEKQNIFFIQTSTVFFKNLQNFQGYSVGDIGLDIILSFKPDSVYLLGFDLAIISKIAHISTHKEDFSKGAYQSKVVVDGNFNNKVETLDIFLQMKINFENIIKYYKIKNIYNLSHGLHIDGTIAKKACSVKINFNQSKSIRLEKFNSKGIKKDDNFLKTVLKQYKILLSPYDTLCQQQNRSIDLKKKQIKYIKSYYESI